MTADRSRELILIGVLAAAALAYLLWLIPAGVPVPTDFGFGTTQISPRFVPRLIAILMLVVLAGRLAAIVAEGRAGRPAPAFWEGPAVSAAWPVIGLCLLFAFFGVEGLGFYLAALILIAATIAILGERRPLVLVVTPVLVVAMVYLLFERLLGVYLPHGAVLGPLFDLLPD